jgi:hypothetical protein
MNKLEEVNKHFYSHNFVNLYEIYYRYIDLVCELYINDVIPTKMNDPNINYLNIIS